MIEIFLALLVIALLVLVVFLLRKLQQVQQELNDILFAKQSQSVRYGKMTEQWLPFSEHFPFDAQSFRFLGSPIDGIAFEENKIVFCEFKTASSKLSEKQQRIKQLVENKQIEWMEMNVK